MNSMELFTYIIIHIYVRKSGARICNTIALVNVVVFLSILNHNYLHTLDSLINAEFTSIVFEYFARLHALFRLIN